MFFGADPEFFPYKDTVYAPAHTFGVPRDQKVKVAHFGTDYDYSHFFRDGWAVEINPTTSTCRAVFTARILGIIRWLQKNLGATELHALPAVKVDLSYLKDAPADVCEFGCSPALDAYTGQKTIVAINAAEHEYRYAGGHCHISGVGNNMSWTKDFAMACAYVQMLDQYLGLPLTYLFGSPELGLRRKAYGKAGEFRLQDYGKTYNLGIEYRTPGPELFLSHATISFAFGVMRMLSQYHKKHDALNEAYLVPREQAERVQKAINAGISEESLLDLVYPLPGFYDRDILRKMKPFCDALPRNIFAAIQNWPPGTAELEGRGWTETVEGETGRNVHSISN